MVIVLFCLVNVIVGLRLLWLAWKSRGQEELYLALTYLLAGGFGWSLVLVSAVAAQRGDPASQESFARLGLLSTNLGCLAHAVFVSLVFRRETRWGMAVVGALALVLAGTFLHNSILQGQTFPGPQEPIQWLGTAARNGIFLWAGVEAFNYYRKLKRREKLGLGDPVVANRVWLWGAGAVATTVLATTASVGYVVAVDAAEFTRQATPIYLACVLAAGTSSWLAFLPPKRYLDWVTRRAARTAEKHHG